MTDDMRRIVDEALVESMPAGLRSAIDAALAKGASHAEILRRARMRAGGRRGPALAVEAYLASIARAEGKRSHSTAPRPHPHGR